MGNLRPADAQRLREKIRRDPVWFREKVLGETAWSKQDEILVSVRDNPRTAVSACHSPGKTRSAARVVLWFLLSYHGSKVITTAPTWRQVEKLLWAEIRGLVTASRVDLGLQIPPKASEAYVSPTWYALGLSTNEPERFQGFHAPAILVVVDEASGVDDAIWQAILGVISSGRMVRVLLLSNPTKAQGFFYDAFTNWDGWNRIKISAFDTPNFSTVRDAYYQAQTKAEKLELLRSVPDEALQYDYLASPGWAAQMLADYGEDSVIYQVRVLSEFPGEQPDQLFPLPLIEGAERLWERLGHRHWWERLDSGRIRTKETHRKAVSLGVDVCRYGDSEGGFAAISDDIMAPLQIWRKVSSPQTAALIHQGQQAMRAREVRVDADGIGGPTIDICRGMGMTVIPFHGGKPAPRTYLNLRSAGFFELKRRLEESTMALPPDPKLKGQLSLLKYRLVGQSLAVTTKEELRKEGKVSPDRADMAMMAVAPVQGLRLANKPEDL